MNRVNPPPRSVLALLSGLAAFGLQAGTTNDLPASAALPLNSSTTPGFVVRSVQGPETPPLANNSIRALRQIDGTLTDASGTLVLRKRSGRR